MAVFVSILLVSLIVWSMLIGYLAYTDMKRRELDRKISWLRQRLEKDAEPILDQDPTKPGE